MEMPIPDVYEEEMRCFPWWKMMHVVINLLVDLLPTSAVVADVMCGTGYLLRQLNERRPDLKLHGIDIAPLYISCARQNCKEGKFYLQDAVTGYYDRGLKPDCIVCMGSLHHIPPQLQGDLLQKMANWLAPDGLFLLADSCIGNYSDDQTRRLAAAELGYQYLRETIERGGSGGVVKAAIDVMYNDIFLEGEWKLTKDQLVALATEYFPQVACHKVWPQWESEYGDYYMVLTK